MATTVEIADQVIAVTGAASGIGRAFAEGFAADGARVIAIDIDGDGLKTLQHDRIEVRQADVTSWSELRKVIDGSVDSYGHIDALCNNAGIARPAAVDDAEDQEFEHVVAVHLFGAVYGVRAALPHMRRQGRGRIVNTLSRDAARPTLGNASYGVAKAALSALTIAVANETAGTDILVNGLIPGPTNTAIWGYDRPELQPPEAVYPTARMLVSLPPGGPTGKVFWNETEYRLFQ